MLSTKQRKRLERIRVFTDSPIGMYPGDYFDSASRQHQKLINAGLAEMYYPHNPVHSARVVICDLGRNLLDSQL